MLKTQNNTIKTFSLVLLQIAFGLSTFSALPKHHANSDTLAIVGRKVITTERFLRLYRDKLVKLGLNDNLETRQGYLQNLIDDEILIAQAKKQKCDRTKTARAEYDRLRTQELLNAYSTKHLYPSIVVTEDDLKELFFKMNTKIKVRHLYAQTKEEADSLYKKLLNGKSFADLAQNVFSDPILKSTGGSLGYISIDEMDPSFEHIAFLTQIGCISRPVKTTRGYSILRVDDIQQNPFVTETEFYQAKEKLKRFVRKRKYEEAATKFTHQLHADLDVRIQENAITRLFSLMQQKPLGQIIENATHSISRNELKRTVVYSKVGNWTTADVLNALRKTTEQQRKWIRTKENFTDYLSGLFLRNYIAQKSKEEGLDSSPLFRETVDYLFDSFLLTTLEDQTKKQIHISPDSIYSYYYHNKDNFKTQPEIRLSVILVDRKGLADSIRQLLVSNVPFDSLAKIYSIQKNTAERGGDLGYLTQQELGEMGNKLFSLETGKWNGPLVNEGKHLYVKCTGRKNSTYRSLNESSEGIKEMLMTLNWHSTRERYVESLKKNIRASIFADRLMKLSIN